MQELLGSADTDRQPRAELERDWHAFGADGAIGAHHRHRLRQFLDAHDRRAAVASEEVGEGAEVAASLPYARAEVRPPLLPVQAVENPLEIGSNPPEHGVERPLIDLVTARGPQFKNAFADGDFRHLHSAPPQVIGEFSVGRQQS